jgi:hypothetical protein
MTTRRSARLEYQDAQEPLEVQQPTPAEGARNSKKRKATETHTEESTKAKMMTTKGAIDKGKKLPSQTQFSSDIDTLSSLPPEMLDMIIENVSR